MVSATATQSPETDEELLLRRKKHLTEMSEKREARRQQLRENAPSSKDFYRLLRDTDFTERCSKLIRMMKHPYLVSVPLGTSRYGEYNILQGGAFGRGTAATI
jgi:hypothetical protein